MPRTYGKSKGKAKQTRLSFVPPSFGLDDKDEEPSRNANLQYSHPSKSTVRRGRSAAEQSLEPAPFVIVEPKPEESSQSEVEVVAPKRASRKSKEAISKPVPSVRVEPRPGKSSQFESKVVAQKRSSRKKEPSRKSNLKNTAPPTPPPAAQASESESELEVMRSARKSTRNKNLKRKRADISESEEPQMLEERDAIRPSPPLPAAQDSESESELEVIHSARKNENMKRKRADISESEYAQLLEESDADEVVSRPRRKLRRGGGPQPIVVDDSSEETEVRAVGPKSPSVPQTPRRDSTQDRIDLDEDLEDLQDSVVRTSRTRGNIANSARAQRQRHLEALRRRRAGNKDGDNEGDHLSPKVEDSEPEDNGDEEEDEDETPVRQPQFQNWANESESSDVESTLGANDDLDRYEEDFVLEDEDEQLGVPSGLEDMPIAFSRHSYKQLKDYFPDAVEWMVHNQLNPAFPRSDPVYNVAFDKLEAEVRGRTGSQFISSVWNTKFRRALLARPQINVIPYPTEFGHACDACNRSGHPASFDVRLSGKAYALDTLEPLADADSDDDEQSSNEDESDKQERDRDGYALPDEDTHFYLGRHCKKNAKMAHTLTHWRVHLNEWIVEHLRITGYMSDKKIVKRSHYSQRKKNKHATKAFTKMVDSGEVKKLWRDFQINLKAARESAVSD
ncbi:hypothetical protein BJX70DRAFT_314647 [Aspergillus crustosus]